jgi:hypothetical protein
MLVAWAEALVRTWTRLYTWRVPPAVRDARRAEIESDLWEFEHDPARPDDGTVAAHILLRWLAGVPDDVCWRRDHRTPADRPARVAMILAVVAIVLASAWVVAVLRPVELPVPPAVQRPPPPSPPPPPPPPPPPRRPSGR